MGTSLSKKARDNIYTCRRDGGLDLNLSDCEIRHLSNKIVRLKLLVKLDVSKNYLQSLPPSLAQLKDLEEFDCSENEITSFPSQLLKLRDLKSLVVSYNKLTSLPGPIASLSSLTKLHISYNSIPKLPDDFASLAPTLQEFAYGGNAIAELPDSLWELVNLTDLDVSQNTLSFVPDNILALTALKKLNIAGNQIAVAPQVIAKITSLTHINISSNKFVTLPDEFCSLPSLEVLKADNNQLLNVENYNFKNLPNLKELTLSQNQLTHFNGTIGHCQQLRLLDLSQNNISYLEHQVGWLGDSLRKLILCDNNLKQLPGEISFLNPAIKLELRGNPLLYPFDILLERGPEAIQDGLRPYIKAYPPNCVAFGEGLTSSFAGKPTSFEVEGFDKRGQPRVNGGDKYSGEMLQLDPEPGKEPARVELIFKDNNDGTYTGFYNCQVAGNYLIKIYESGDPIKGTWNCYIAPDVTNPQFCTAEGPGLVMGAVGLTSEFTIHARDRFGNQQDHGGEPFVVVVQGGSQPRPIIQDNQDGSYHVQFNPGWPAVYAIHVMYNGTPIPGSPVSINISQ